MVAFYVYFKSTCPHCGEVHDLRAQTYATVGDPAKRGLVVGREFDMAADLLARGYYRVRDPEPGKPIRILETATGAQCGGWPFPTRLSIVDGILMEATLVQLTLAELDQLHWLPDRSSSLWDWASSLEPPLGNDQVHTQDPVRELRHKLLLREPLTVRNFVEARQLVTMCGYLPHSPPTRLAPDGSLWLQPIKRKPEYTEADFSLVFDVEDPTELDEHEQVVEFAGGPSKILSPEVYRDLASGLADGVPFYTADIEHDADDGLSREQRDLAQAIIYLDQLLRFIPDGETHVPVDAFWGDMMRDDREQHPRPYERSIIEGTLARWRADLPRLHQPWIIPTRTAAEMDLFMSATPCPDCGKRIGDLRSRVELLGGETVAVYAGSCAHCRLPRRFVFRITDQIATTRGDALVFGEGLSRALDPGQLLSVASDLASQVPGDLSGLDPTTRGRAAFLLAMAIGALDEALKFIPDGADAVPPDTITSRQGWAVYVAEPGRFRRDRLTAVRTAYAEIRHGAGAA